MKSAVAFLLLLAAIPASAGPKKLLLGTAKSYSDTGKNLFTFHNKTAAIQGWILIAATGLDAGTTVARLRGCPACVESNPLFGKHPSTARILGEGAPLVATEVTLDYALAEKADTKGRYAFTWGAVGGIAALHSWLAGHNLNLVRQCQLARLEGCQ